MAKSQVTISGKDATKAAFASVKAELGGMTRALRTATLAIGGYIGITGVAGMIKASLQQSDAFAKAADTMGMVTQRYAGLSLASELAGTDVEKLNKGMETMLKNVNDAAHGMGIGTRALSALNIGVNELSSLSPDQQLEKIMVAMSRLENVTLRAGVAQQLFGGGAKDVLRLMVGGENVISGATADMVAWGAALSRTDSAKIEEANDAMTRLKYVSQGFFNTVTVQLSPIVATVANQFANSAKETKGFRDEVLYTMEKVTVAIAYTANVVRGLNVVWEGGKVIIADYMNNAIQAIRGIDHVFVDMVNKIGGSWVGKKLGVPMLEYSQVVDDVADVSTARVDELRDGFAKLVMEPMPADNVLAWFQKVKEGSQKTAEEIARSRQGLFGSGAGIEDTEGDAKRAAAIQKKLDGIRQQQMTEQELEIQHYGEKAAILAEAYQARLLTDEEFDLAKEALTKQHQEKLTAIEDAEAKKRYGIQNVFHNLSKASTKFALGTVSNLMQSENKKQFEIGKKASIALTWVNTYDAAMGAYKALAAIPIVGPFLGAAAALAAIAFGKSQVDKIKSQSFGGEGGSTGTPTFSASPNTGLPTGTPGGDMSAPQEFAAAKEVSKPRIYNVTLTGPSIDAQQVRDFMDLMAAEEKDGVRIGSVAYA